MKQPVRSKTVNTNFACNFSYRLMRIIQRESALPFQFYQCKKTGKMVFCMRSTWTHTAHTYTQPHVHTQAARNIFGTFVSSWRAQISFVFSVCLPVCLSICILLYRRGSHWMDFGEMWHRQLLLQSVDKLQIWLNSDKNVGQLYVKTSVALSLATEIRHESFVTRQSILLYSWQWHTAP